ncbi:MULTISPECIES: hypothetical protein [Sphingobium]|jgi:hypothetical protein|uniref:hypothetical protein n=1 Tax=Sphingobium TaxID=165695 RepID=UPI00243147E2|nr:hypothetical protein [Sphingobium yanoikuyae]
MSVVDIIERVVVLRAEAGFDVPDLWLTFYLSGSPATLDRVAEALSRMEAVNLADGDGGFLYPKLRAPESAEDIASLIEQVGQIAKQCGATLLSVDLDTSRDPSTSRFAEIIRYDD